MLTNQYQHHPIYAGAAVGGNHRRRCATLCDKGDRKGRGRGDETRPDPLAFTQELLQVVQDGARDWIRIAKELAAEEWRAPGAVTEPGTLCPPGHAA